MSIVQVPDVQTNLPTLVIRETSVPSATQVAQFIGEIENEVRARLEAAGASWPADGSTAAQYLKTTILEGVTWRTLRAKYAMSSTQGRTPEVAEAYKSYQDRLADVAMIARSQQNVQNTQPGQGAATNVPKVSAGTHTTPNLASSFAEYSQARDILDYNYTMNRWQGNRPWPLT